MEKLQRKNGNLRSRENNNKYFLIVLKHDKIIKNKEGVNSSI
jgi:hypothetical protein